MAPAIADVMEAGIATIEGRLTTATGCWRSASLGFDAPGMPLFRDAVDLRLGLALGGEDGRRLADDATARLTAIGVKNPVRLAEYLCPGGSPSSGRDWNSA